MKFSCKSLTFFISIAFTASSLSTAQAESIAFKNVTLVNIDGETPSGKQTVLVEDDRIVAIGASVDIDVNTKVINADGQYLLPGFAEMHSHIPQQTAGEQAIKDTLFMYVANGVTTVRGMLGGIGQLDLRAKANNGEIVSPTLYLAGPSFSGGSINSVKQATAKVERQKKQGWDLLKIHPGLTLDQYKAMASKANELGLEFGGHVPAEVGLDNILKYKQRTVDHLDGYVAYMGGESTRISDDKLQEIAQRTKNAGVGMVPTMALWRSLLNASDLKTLQSQPELQYMPQATVDGWTNYYKAPRNTDFLKSDNPTIRNENRMRLLQAMDDAGVEILFGTDSPQVFSVPGFSIHHEIDAMQEAGMSNRAILKSATVAAGDYFDDKDKFGSIRVGYRADLILVSDNPITQMDTLKSPIGVMTKGQWYTKSDIDNELKAIAKRAKSQ
jgi:imidazolonepropionase-like amidohydrolase